MLVRTSVHAANLHQPLGELLQLLVIRDDDLEDAVELAGEVVALEHLGQRRDAGAELLHRVRAVVGQHHEHEAHQVEPDGLPVDHGHVTLDHPVLFETPQPLLHTGG